MQRRRRLDQTLPVHRPHGVHTFSGSQRDHSRHLCGRSTCLCRAPKRCDILGPETASEAFILLKCVGWWTGQFLVLFCTCSQHCARKFLMINNQLSEHIRFITSEIVYAYFAGTAIAEPTGILMSTFWRAWIGVSQVSVTTLLWFIITFFKETCPGQDRSH